MATAEESWKCEPDFYDRVHELHAWGQRWLAAHATDAGGQNSAEFRVHHALALPAGTNDAVKKDMVVLVTGWKATSEFSGRLVVWDGTGGPDALAEWPTDAAAAAYSAAVHRGGRGGIRGSRDRVGAELTVRVTRCWPQTLAMLKHLEAPWVRLREVHVSCPDGTEGSLAEGLVAELAAQTATAAPLPACARAVREIAEFHEHRRRAVALPLERAAAVAADPSLTSLAEVASRPRAAAPREHAIRARVVGWWPEDPAEVTRCRAGAGGALEYYYAVVLTVEEHSRRRAEVVVTPELAARVFEGLPAAALDGDGDDDEAAARRAAVAARLDALRRGGLFRVALREAFVAEKPPPKGLCTGPVVAKERRYLYATGLEAVGLAGSSSS